MNFLSSYQSQRNQPGSSPAVEYMGFQQFMEFLFGCGVLITTFVSDSHTTVTSHMKQVLSNIVHYFDIGHLKKRKHPLIKCMCTFGVSVQFSDSLLHSPPKLAGHSEGKTLFQLKRLVRRIILGNLMLLLTALNRSMSFINTNL